MGCTNSLESIQVSSFRQNLGKGQGTPIIIICNYQWGDLVKDMQSYLCGTGQL